MRVGLARIIHRSNSFARTATTHQEFEQWEYLAGDEVVERYQGTGSVLGGAIRESREHEIELAGVFSAGAPAGGPLERECIESLARSLVSEIRNLSVRLDSLILEMSGTMTSTAAESGETEIISRLRREYRDLNIILVLSAQANFTEELTSLVDALVSPSRIPNDNPTETGRRSIDAARSLKDSTDSVQQHFERVPIIIPVASQRTDQEPLASFSWLITEYEHRAGIAGISFFVGYPYADVAHAGASIVVRGSDGVVREVVDELRSTIWNRREEFYVAGNNVEEAVHEAMASKAGPVLIADLGDNPDDGAPGDGTTVLWALLDLGVRNATVGAIVDEQAVEACFRAGVDAKVEIPVGGRKDTRHGYPIDVRGKVVSVHEGCFNLTGPINRGLPVDPGRVVVLDIEARHDGHVELILTEQPIQITDTSFFEHVGIDLQERAIVSIKSANDYRPAFESVANQIFEVITPGITTPDPAFYAYQNVCRPIFPLDSME